MRNKQGKWRMSQDLVSGAARRKFVQARVAIAAHHQQVCTELPGLLEECDGNLVFLPDGAVF